MFCEVCSYRTARKNDLKRHFKTKKHIRNATKFDSQRLPNDSQRLPNDSQRLPNDSQMTPNSKLVIKCPYCNKTFTRNNNKTRHIKKSCKVKKQRETIKNQPQIIYNITNNTTNNTNNNNINNFLMVSMARQRYFANNYLKLLSSDGIRRKDILKNLIEHSTQLKKDMQVQRIQDFRVTNKRDNYIQVRDKNNNWITEFFDKHMKQECLENTEALEKVLKEFYKEEENTKESPDSIFIAIRETLLGDDEYINQTENEVYTLLNLFKEELKNSKRELYNHTNKDDI